MAHRQQLLFASSPSPRMKHDSDHAGAVQAWLDTCTRDASPPVILARFEFAFNLLWGHTLNTLSDVTLVAIGERVLLRATEAHPWLAPLAIDGVGLKTAALGETVGRLEPDALRAGFGFTLQEFMRVLGALTGEILSPGLHRTLLSIHPNDIGSVAPAKARHDGERGSS